MAQEVGDGSAAPAMPVPATPPPAGSSVPGSSAAAPLAPAAPVPALNLPVPVPSGRRQRRSVRLADFDRLCRQVEALSVQGEQLTSDIQACCNRADAVEDKLRATGLANQGLDVLRAVAHQQEYALGRALQKVLAMRLLERIRACPSRPPAGNRVVTGRARQEQTAIVLDVPFPRSGVDDLTSMLSLAYERRSGRRTTRPTRVVQFEGASGVLSALGIPVVQSNMCRQFLRKDGSAPARALVERLADDGGRLFYVKARHKDSDDVLVCVRESEAYHVRRRCFVHQLVEKRVSRDALPELPDDCPAFLSWRESPVSASIDEWDGPDACGVVTLSLPCCTMEVLPSDVADLVMQMTP